MAFLLEVAQSIDFPLVTAIDFVNVLQPIVEMAETTPRQRCLDAAAAIMPAHYNVFHFENFNRILQYRKYVVVTMGNDVRDIAMNEDFTRVSARNLISRYAAVGTTNPQIFRVLAASENMKIFGFFGESFVHPFPITFQQALVGFFHNTWMTHLQAIAFGFIVWIKDYGRNPREGHSRK